jgi:hypothetical protein
LRSLQEIQPDFVEEAGAWAGLWSQGKKKKKKKKKKNMENMFGHFNISTLFIEPLPINIIGSRDNMIYSLIS